MLGLLGYIDFFLFLGIALLVYHLAFKFLGILLFVIEIYWFILQPIIKEMKQWWFMKSEMSINKKTIRLMAILSIILMGLFLPWKSSLKIPAVYVSEQYSKIYSPYPAKIEEIFVEKDDVVKKGQYLIELKSPQLEQKINSTRRKIQLIKTKINRISKSAGNLDQYMTLQQRLIELKTELTGLNKLQSKLKIKSPTDGKIKNFSYLSKNQWVSNLDELMGIVKYGTGNVVGFLKEEEIYRFKLDSNAVFIPFDGQHDNIKLVSKSLDQSAVSVLPYPSLISKYGGPIASRPFISGDFESRPVTAHYKVSFDLINKDQTVDWQLPGYVHVKGNRYSPFIKFTKNILSLLVRESGF